MFGAYHHKRYVNPEKANMHGALFVFPVETINALKEEIAQNEDVNDWVFYTLTPEVNES